MLSRAGSRGTLSPWSSPLYRAFRLSTVGGERFSFLVSVLLAYGATRPVPLTKRVWYGAKALSEVLRGATRG